jgi:two-component system, NtrC family, sensor kinase
MTLQNKIIASFLISSVLIAALAVFSYVNFIEIRREISNLELSDTLRSKTLQLRRHEKNVLLYRDIKEIESVHAYISEIRDILVKNIGIDSPGQLSDLQGRIEDYDQRFSRMESLTSEFLEHISKLKSGHPEYAVFFPLMESTFLESPAVNANQIKQLFKLKPESRILFSLSELDVEISSLRKIGEEILIKSKDFDSATRDKVDHTIWITQIALLILFPLFLIVGFTALFVIVHSAVVHLRVLATAIEKTGKGDFSSLPEPSKHDEVGMLIHSFNKMEEDLINRDKEITRKNEELLQSRKLASLGTLASGVAHELNNPLNNIYLAAQILTREIDTETCPGIIKETVGDIYSQTLRVKRIVSDLLDFAREKPPEIAPVQITVLIKGILTQMAAADDLGDVRYAIQAQEDAMVLADSHMMEQVFINLFDNAVDAMEGRGLLTVAIDRAGRSVKITVSDTGKGIPKEKLPRIFDPFFTTKDHGTGLGLAIVYSIIEKHKGKIDLQNTSEKGSTFVITLPGEI